MADEVHAPINLKLDTEAFARQWAEFAVDQLHQALDLNDIGKLDGDLWRSLQKQVIANGGDVHAVVIKFLQYGRFVDMGVGRGVSIGAAGTKAFSAARNDNGTLKHYARKPKKWFSRTYYHQVQRFTELYARNFSQQIPVQISDALTAKVTLTA